MIPPTGYKGGKRKLAPQIVDTMLGLNADADWYCDLCCGSGAVLLALADRGISPSKIVAVEAGPWGMFWRSIADGTFNLDRLRALLFDALPDDARDVARWCEQDVAGQEISPETFLVLQAASYGSTPVWHDGAKWRRGDASANRGYKARGYWEPGPTSKETKPRGTIFQVAKIVDRTRDAMTKCKGMRVIWGLLENAELPSGGVYYLDPPYEGGTGYGYTLDVGKWVATAPRPLIVSEGKATPGATWSELLATRRGAAVTKGSTRKPEYMNVYVATPPAAAAPQADASKT